MIIISITILIAYIFTTKMKSLYFRAIIIGYPVYMVIPGTWWFMPGTLYS